MEFIMSNPIVLMGICLVVGFIIGVGAGFVLGKDVGKSEGGYND